jgi:hypothetical protein
LLADTIAKKLIGGVLTTERKFVEGSDRRRNDSTTKKREDWPLFVSFMADQLPNVSRTFFKTSNELL